MSIGTFHLLTPDGVILVEPESPRHLDAAIMAAVSTNAKMLAVVAEAGHVVPDSTQYVALVDNNGVLVS